MTLQEFFSRRPLAPPRIMDPSGHIELALDFSNLPLAKLPRHKKLILIYCNTSYSLIKSLIYFLTSDSVCILFPDSLSIDSKRKIELRYRPNFILDKKREDLSRSFGVSGETTCYKYSEDEIELAPGLKLVLSTSGSTGSPKLVKLSTENLIANASQILNYLPITSDDRCLVALPLCYAYGLSILTTHLAAGACLIPNSEVVSSPGFWSRAEALQVNSFSAVPFRHEAIINQGMSPLLGLNLKYLTNAGGRLRLEAFNKMAKHCLERGIEFYNMYGQTEATARIAYLPHNLTLTKPGAIGKAVSGGELSIDPESGELLYKGPNIFCGYAERVEDLAKLEPQNILRTGDLATVDDDGIFSISGRMKRILKVNGLRLNLDELEGRLAAQFGKPIYCTGSDEGLLLCFMGPPEIDPKSVEQWLLSSLTSLPASVFAVRQLPSIPLTSSGKVDYPKVLMTA